jgi:hypothetical protein
MHILESMICQEQLYGARLARPNTPTRMRRKQRTHTEHHKAGMMIITRGLLLFFVLLPAASCLKFRLTILKKM